MRGLDTLAYDGAFFYLDRDIRTPSGTMQNAMYSANARLQFAPLPRTLYADTHEPREIQQIESAGSDYISALEGRIDRELVDYSILPGRETINDTFQKIKEMFHGRVTDLVDAEIAYRSNLKRFDFHLASIATLVGIGLVGVSGMLIGHSIADHSVRLQQYGLLALMYTSCVLPFSLIVHYMVGEPASGHHKNSLQNELYSRALDILTAPSDSSF